MWLYKRAPILRLEVKKKIKTRKNHPCHRTSCQRPTSGLEVRPHVNTRIPRDDHQPHLNNLGRYAHGLCRKYHLRCMRWNHMMTHNSRHHRRRPCWWHRLCGDRCYHWCKIRRCRRRSRVATCRFENRRKRFENLAPKFLYQIILVNYCLLPISPINNLLYLLKPVLLPVSGMSKT